MRSSSRRCLRSLFTLLVAAGSVSAQAQTVSFIKSQDYAVGSQPLAVQPADFNADGLTDLAVANSLSDTVSILLGRPGGDFGAAEHFAAGSRPQSVAIGDFNGDGSPDLAVADRLGGVSVLQGNGDGTFQTARPFAAGTNPTSVIASDLNLDGMLDLAVTNESSNNVSVLLGTGDGGFQPARAFGFGPGTRRPMSVAAGDLNGDGVPDLAVANFGERFSSDQYQLGNVAILIGTGNGTFQPAQLFDTGWEPDSLALADFNNDGRLDVATASFLSGNTIGAVSLLLGNGDGTLQAHYDVVTAISSQSYPASVTAGDVNSDGAADLIVAHTGGTTTRNAAVVSALLGTGDGTFQHPMAYAIGKPVAVAIADVNGDGILDLAAANGSPSRLAVFAGNGDGTFQGARAFGPGGREVDTGDMNGDGILDVVIATDTPTSLENRNPGISILVGNGDGTLQTVSTSPVGGTPSFITSIAIGDLNGDGFLDVAAACAGQLNQAGSINVFLGNGDGTLQPAQTWFAANVPRFLVIGDFNRDGALDVALANQNEDAVSVLIGNGDGTFQPAQILAAGPYPSAVAIGDLNRDGALDLVVSNRGTPVCSNDCTLSGSNVLVYFGNGDGTFDTQSMLAAGQSPGPVVIGDINGDGLNDLAVAAAGDATESSHVAILLGNGDGTFQAAQHVAAPGFLGSMVSADFNGDHALDLGIGASGIQVLAGNGDGSFLPPVNFGPDIAFRAAVGDLNGDGKPDIVTHTAAVLINNAASRPTSYSVSVYKHGSGTVVSTSDAAIDCGTNCAATYLSGTVVTLTAQPDAGWKFVAWDGCDAVSDTSCTVTVRADAIVTASFAVQRFTLSVQRSGIGSGTVTSASNPPAASEINCGTVCSGWYDWNTIVTLTAKPSLGSLFTGWAGCDASSGNTCTVTMRAAKSVTASFFGIPRVAPLASVWP